MSLVDNQDFLVWSLNFMAENPDGEILEPMPPLPDVAMKLLSSEGASPIENATDLESALDTIFYQRAGEFLENPAILDLPFFDSIESCTEDTQTAGFNI